MRIGFLIFLFSFSLSLIAQNKEQHFPTAWIGEWVGELNIYSAGGIARQLQMELHIQDLEGVGRWGWTIIYVGDTSDVRRYELLLKDASKSQYVIDEKNSILLDAYYLGNTLSSRFSVNKNLLLINYTFEDDQIVFDVFSGSLEESTLTGEEITFVEEIRSFQMGSRQQAILKRRE